MSWRIKKKYLDLLARESGYEKKIWGKTLSVCLAYPNVYRVAMANLGFQTVYGIINSHPDCLCERAFLPDPDDEHEFSGGAVSLSSLESQKPLSEFDVIAFSIPFENDYPNILRMLEMAGIPLLRDERGAAGPLIIGGGISVTLNPEPIADFFDLFLIGEAEGAIEEFIELWMISRDKEKTKEQLLRDAQIAIPGVYVPGLYSASYDKKTHQISGFKPRDDSLPEKIERRWAKDITAFETSQRITASGSEFGEMFLTEISRGCGHGCRFCAAGFVYRPVRFRGVDTIMGTVDRGLQMGKKIGLLGTAVSDHPDLVSLCRLILDRGGGLAIGSLRMDRLGDDVASLLREAGVETVALAPECGSRRLRDVVRKNISDEQIFTAVEKLVMHEIPNIRLYFMIGLPTETDDDIEAIIRLVKSINHYAVKASSGTKRFRRITVSLNQFIPKPATPFQWYPLEDTGVVRKKITKIKRALQRYGAISVIHDLPKWNYVQALLSLGDRRVSGILMAVHKYGGNWSRAFKETSLNPDYYVYREKHKDEILPWGFIDHGFPPSLLLREYEKTKVS